MLQALPFYSPDGILLFCPGVSGFLPLWIPLPNSSLTPTTVSSRSPGWTPPELYDFPYVSWNPVLSQSFLLSSEHAPDVRHGLYLRRGVQDGKVIMMSVDDDDGDDGGADDHDNGDDK